MRRPRIIIMVLAAASLFAGYALCSKTIVNERALLTDLASDRVFADKVGDPPVYRSSPDLVAFNSHDIVPGVRGYAGPIKALIVLGSDGRIRGLRIIEHRETKNYVHYLETPEYLNRFINKSVFDAFEVDNDIDGITRATVSVEALAETVRESSRKIAADVFGIDVKAGGTAAAAGPGWLWYGIVFCCSFAGYALSRRSKKYPFLRDISLAAGLLIIGLYLASPFSILQVFNLVLSGPSPSLLWYTIVGTTLLSLAIAGRFYCGWLCPFGALSEFLGRLPLRKWEVPAAIDERWRNLKYVLLGAAIIAVFLGCRAEPGNYEVYVTLFSRHGSVLAWTFVGVTVLANLRIKRFWCRYLCPVAAFMGLLFRKTRGYPSVPDCPMGNRPDPDMAECVRCNRCYVRPENVPPNTERPLAPSYIRGGMITPLLRGKGRSGGVTIIPRRS